MSADRMGGIAKESIKKLVHENFGVKISDDAAEALSELLDDKAQRIAKYAVGRARDKDRKTILEEDIEAYRLKFGD